MEKRVVPAFVQSAWTCTYHAVDTAFNADNDMDVFRPNTGQIFYRRSDDF